MAITKTKKKKDGKQQYRVRVMYRDIDGNPKQVERTAYGYAEAIMMEQQLLADVEAKKVSAAKLTVQDLYEEYAKYHQSETRITSHKSAMKNLRLHVLPTMAQYRLDKLTRPVLSRWKIALNDTDLALRTKQNAYAAFVAMLNYAVKMEYIHTNPLKVLGNFKDTSDFSQPLEKLHYYTSEQFLKYIEVAHKHTDTLIDWGCYVFFNIAFYTGARKGEINALKWSDIDGNIMHIRRSISQKVAGDDVEGPPKNRSSYRDLQIPEPLLKILAEHKERQRNAAVDFSDDYRVCGGIAPLRDTTIDKHNRKFAQEAGLPHIRVHDFRHTHASLLANNGINIQEIARRLGHSNVQMTWNTYSHLYPREEERAIKVLNEIVESHEDS